MVEPLRHRQTKEAATDMFCLKPPRHISTLHITDNPAALAFVRYWGNSGQRWILAGDGLSAYDPTATLAVHCGNGFDVGFSPYQSTRLIRYDAVS
jgi:hypothetical protein